MARIRTVTVLNRGPGSRALGLMLKHVGKLLAFRNEGDVARTKGATEAKLADAAEQTVSFEHMRRVRWRSATGDSAELTAQF